jgi:hypothetical protein
MQDDFYWNLLDWSSQNVLAVGLGNTTYLLDASRDKVSNRGVLEWFPRLTIEGGMGMCFFLCNAGYQAMRFGGG